MIQSTEIETTEELKVLQSSLRKHGLDYKFIKRNEKCAMYEQSFEGKTIGFEVFHIKVYPAAIVHGVFHPKQERFPRDEEFGRYAWATTGRVAAEKLFERETKLLNKFKSLHGLGKGTVQKLREEFTVV